MSFPISEMISLEIASSHFDECRRDYGAVAGIGGRVLADFFKNLIAVMDCTFDAVLNAVGHFDFH